MVDPVIMLSLAAIGLLLGQGGIYYQLIQLTNVALTTKGHVRGIQNSVSDVGTATVAHHEFDELRKLVFSQNHIIRALHDEIAEMQKKGGGKTATKKVVPKSNQRRRPVHNS